METDKYIEAEDGNFVTEKQTGQVQIKMSGNNRKLFISTLYNVLFAPDFCDRLFSIVTLINLRHTCLYYKVFVTVLFGDNEQNAVKLPHSAQIKHSFLVKIKDK